MKRKHIKESWLYCKAKRGQITVHDGFTGPDGHEYHSVSVHEWQHDGFVMTHCSMTAEAGERIPDSRIYGWSDISGRPTKLSIIQILKSNVTLDAIKTAICKIEPNGK